MVDKIGTRVLPVRIMLYTALAMLLSLPLHLLFINRIHELLDLPSPTVLAESLSSYITVIGVIYALMVGFTFQQAVERHRDLRNSLHREAGSLHNILLLSEVMQEGEAAPIVAQSVGDYVNSNLEVANPSDPRLTSAIHDLYGIIPHLNELASDDVDDEVDQVTLRAIHAELREVSRAQADRSAICYNRLPPAQWFSLWFLAFLLLMGFFLLDLESTIIESLLFTLVVGSVTVLMMIMVDLDKPLEGVWVVKSSALQWLLLEIERLKGNP